MAENIRVCCRIRPMNNKEITMGTEVCISFPGPNSLACGGKTFTFDAVCQPKCTQKEVYDCIAKPMVDSFLNGFNGTIFAYGQTSAGKSFTMEGVVNDELLKGITPRIIDDMFDHIENFQGNVSFLIKVAYFEIYLEKIKDLFDTTKDNLAIAETANRVPYVKGATEKFVGSPDEVFECLEEGKANRHTTGTNMNAVSSRSHSIFLLTVTQKNEDTGQELSGKLYLVDLAGSEKVGKTGAEGQTLEEAKQINKSLSALGNVINALVEGSNHIPYRDSKLTRILQESLGGNAKTTMIICCSPAKFNEFETKSTLLFGVRAKAIKNCVQANVEMSAAEWKRLYEKEQDLVRKLRAIIASLEAELKRWRAGEKVDKSEWFTEEKYKAILDSKSAPGGGGGTGTGSCTVTDAPAPAKGGKAGGGAGGGAAARGGGGSASNDELYKQLDEKDDEINKITQAKNKAVEQLADLQHEIETLKKETDMNTSTLTKAQNDAETSKHEVKEVLQALEELALSFDQKAADCENKVREIEILQDKLAKVTTKSDEMTMELGNSKEAVATHKKKFCSTIQEMLNDLGEAGLALNPEIGTPTEKDLDKTDEAITVMRLYISKIKSEAKSIKKKMKDLETDRQGNTEKIKEFEKKTHSLEVTTKEAEARLKTAKETIKELEDGKKKLEHTMDDALGKDNKNGNIKSVLDGLRTEVDNKTKEYNALKEKFDSMNVQLESTTKDLAKYTAEMNEKNTKLEIFEKQTERRDQAKLELKGLEENVIRELQTLHNLRKMFVSDLKSRIKKASSRATVQQMIENDEEDEFENQKGSVLQREKITFLENNLDNLTKVHKQLVRDNADLRCELPKMEKRLKATMERVKQLETALKEAKEGAMRDRKRYQHEVDRIKEAVRQKGLNKPKTNVARPIRPGQRRESAGAN